MANGNTRPAPRHIVRVLVSEGRLTVFDNARLLEPVEFDVRSRRYRASVIRHFAAATGVSTSSIIRAIDRAELLSELHHQGRAA